MSNLKVFGTLSSLHLVGSEQAYNLKAERLIEHTYNLDRPVENLTTSVCVNWKMPDVPSCHRLVNESMVSKAGFHKLYNLQ